MKLSPEEKENKKRRDALQALCNRISSGFSFKAVRTWSDVYKFTSIPPNTPPTKLTQEVTFNELKEYFALLKTELEAFIEGAAKAPAKEESKPEPELVVHPAEIPCIDNDYLLPATPREHKDLIRYWFQRKAAKECLDKINNGIRAVQIIASAGYGKTFIIGAVLARLVDSGFTKGKTFGPVHILYVTKNSVVEQTKRVFEKMFRLTVRDGFEVINYEQLRSKAGMLWVKEKVTIVGGEEQVTWEWRPMLNPVVICWDENQSLKNYGSLQHQIACQFNNIATPTWQFFISATPYMRVSEAKCFAVATRKDVTGVLGTKSTLSNDTWSTYAALLSGNTSPEEYNEAAVERLTKDLEPYIIRVRGVRPQFRAINKIRMINFASAEERKYYDETEERYLREREKLQKDVDSGLQTNYGLLHLVLLTKRAIAAEYCRRHHFADYGIECVRSGYAFALGVKYKTTLIPVVKIWMEQYGIPRDKIALVWGGGQTQLTKKQKAKAEIKQKADQLALAGINVDNILETLDLDDVEDRVLEDLPEHMKLGSQSKEERQREIDKFQSGKALFCVYTFRAGGVGLSLHHTDELTTQKVRRQKNGYAIVEDIPNIPTRQRKVALSVAYSGIDMVQSTGRVPRLTSLSDTEQECFLYNDTVEVDIAHIYSAKLRCLNRVVKMHESWIDLIVGGNREELVKAHLKDVPSEVAADDEDEVTYDTGSDEE